MRPRDIAWDAKADLPPLAAGFRTCKEVLDDIDLEVTGEIPAYVNGKLFRNGLGVYEATHKNGEVSHINHWFDGISVVHRFAIDGASGTVTYKNRRTGRDVLEAMEAAPSKAAFRMVTFGNQDPCRGLLGNLFQMWRPISRHPTTGQAPNNVSVSLERVPTLGPLESRTDYNRAEVLDIDTLECTRQVRFADLNPQLSGMATAAHGVVDPDTGAYMNYTYAHGPNPEYNVFECTAKETRTLARFRDYPSYIHSIAVTKNYVVLILYSAMVKSKKSLASTQLLFHEVKTVELTIMEHEGLVFEMLSSTPSYPSRHSGRRFTSFTGMSVRSWGHRVMVPLRILGKRHSEWKTHMHGSRTTLSNLSIQCSISTRRIAK